MLVSTQRSVLHHGYSVPAWNLPLTPPSTGASSPYKTSNHRPPQDKDLVYVTQRLGSRSQQHTRRFSYENPMWPDEEGYLLDLPPFRIPIQDDDATTVNDSLRTSSRCSQNTLWGTVTPDGQGYNTTAIRPSGLPQSTYQKALPPTPSDDHPDFLSWSKDPPKRLRKCSLATSSTSGPVYTRQVSSPMETTSTVDPSGTATDGLKSWPTFAAQRDAPQPPVLEEKSIWDDSDSEDDAEPDRLSRFRRRVSNILRAFLCASKPPRRNSA